ncbi:MAG: hypothetical protein E6J49_02875, partial [Chloroflexi bacterium]
MSVTKVILPKLGLTMDEGRVIAWHKKEGDRIAKGEILFEVETDKANMEIESPASGYVRRILLPADASAPVATVIGLISDTADEPLPSLSEVVPSAAQATPSVAAATPSVAAMTPPSDGERVRSSPAARKRAQELGVDIASVRGTGPGGRINIEDVEAAAGGPAAARAAPGGNGVPEKREPLSRMRRAVAEAMTRSVREAPQFSISRDVDMSNADRRRKAAGASYTDVIVSAAAKALRAHPRLRSRLDGDALVTTERIDVG